MPSKSEKQRRFFQAVKRAKEDPSYGDARLRKVAASMTKKDIEDFASSVAELKMKKTLIGILKDIYNPSLINEIDISGVNPIAKRFQVKDDFLSYTKRYIGQPLLPKELQAIDTFKQVKPSRIDRTEIWYENVDDFQNNTTTIIKKMKDGNQFSFVAFQKHSNSNLQQKTKTNKNLSPQEQQKDDIIVSKSPIFNDEIKGAAILVEFLKKLDI